ncbi:Prefoldin [Sistotremastrum niveocremeum HHB9708]|uniref:Prefoldin n=1 Tax=Sistotremastrum niveocremeum HHB9708 TaxID=1314777 RepID=A0A164SSH7_9AGAM|nr:Prefoldin [Sistotremastrum niveocremeum HHB9708]
MSTSAAERLQGLSREYQKLQGDLETAVDARQRLDAQLTENEQVKKEFAQLKEHNTVYKLIGPVLVKQEQSSAKANVDNRLEFIRREMKRIEASIVDLEQKSDAKRTELVQLQASIQQPPAPAVDVSEAGAVVA